MNDRMKSLRNISVQTMGIALLAVWGTAPVAAAEPTEAEKAAYEQSFEGYCQSVEDFLDARPFQTGGNILGTEDTLIRWGIEQGIQGLDGEIPLSQRRKALDSVYRLIMKKYLPDVTVWNKAPDAGVKVKVGEPVVVMWAPEGNPADFYGNVAKLGHLGPTLAREGRWAQYMGPRINKLRNGMLLVTVYAGGDRPVKGEYQFFYYVSDDGGKNWRHFAAYEFGSELPARDIVPALSGQLPYSTPLTDVATGEPSLWTTYTRYWEAAEEIPGSNFYPFLFKDRKSVTARAHVLEFPNGNWVAAFRHGGMYWSGGGPLIIRKSSDQGKTWSKPKAIRVPGVNPVGLALANGIGVFTYQRPGVFLTFCADGKGDLWGNDVMLVKAPRHARNENSCCNGSFVVTGKDRFIYAYTKWDVPDPWGQPRQAVLAQEFIVTRK
jgi:hypothetical protein